LGALHFLVGTALHFLVGIHTCSPCRLGGGSPWPRKWLTFQPPLTAFAARAVSGALAATLGRKPLCITF
jgi:hypothetical protein